MLKLKISFEGPLGLHQIAPCMLHWHIHREKTIHININFGCKIGLPKNKKIKARGKFCFRTVSQRSRGDYPNTTILLTPSSLGQVRVLSIRPSVRLFARPSVRASIRPSVGAFVRPSAQRASSRRANPHKLFRDFGRHINVLGTSAVLFLARKLSKLCIHINFFGAT